MRLDSTAYLALCSEAYACKTAGTLDIDVAAGRAIVRQTADALTFVCPGTDDGETALADLDFFPHHCSDFGCAVHEGMLDAVDGMWLQVLTRATAAAGPVGFGGHSLGAALAVLLAAKLCVYGRPPAFVIGFGCPRVAVGSAIADILTAHNVTTVLYRNGADVVPELPPDLLGIDWRHGGRVTQIGKRRHPIDDHFLSSYAASFAALAPALSA